MHKIVEALAVKLSRVEEQDLKRGGTKNLEAYESWLRARQLLGIGTRETIAEAKALHRRALELDPNFSAPHVGLAFASVSDYVNAWIPDAQSALAEGERWARRAIELDERQPGGHVAMGNVRVWQRRHDDALTELHRAVELDHNYAQGHALLGMAYVLGHKGKRWNRSPWRCARPLYPNSSAAAAQAPFSMCQDEIAPPLGRAHRAQPQPRCHACFWRPRMGLSAIDELASSWTGLLYFTHLLHSQREGVLALQDARISAYPLMADQGVLP